MRFQHHQLRIIGAKTLAIKNITLDRSLLSSLQKYSNCAAAARALTA